MITKIKEFAKTRWGLAILAFIAGGLVTVFLLPEIKIGKTEKEIEYRDRIVEKEVVKYVDRIVEKEVIRTEKVKVVKHKETFPDGRIVEDEIYESETEQLDRMKEQYEEKYREVIAEQERIRKERESELMITFNPKKITVYGGAGVSTDNPLDLKYLAGFNYNLWGPVVVGAQADTEPGVAVTVGIKF